MPDWGGKVAAWFAGVAAVSAALAALVAQTVTPLRGLLLLAFVALVVIAVASFAALLFTGTMALRASWRNRQQAHAAEVTSTTQRERASVEAALKPLEPHYGDAVRYRHMIGNMTEHRIGLRNPAGNPAATGVRLEWTEMEPRPSVQNVYWERWLPAIPSAVPRVAGGDPAIGISLPPGREEVWTAVSTATAPDGTMNAVEFGPGHGSSRGNWHGLLWDLESGGPWRLSYRIVTDNLPAGTFSLVIAAEDGKIECALED